MVTFIGNQWSPTKTKARKWTRMLSFRTVWKLNPGFWSPCLTWRRKQHNEGRESGGKGAQKYGRRENVVREAGDSYPPVPSHYKHIPQIVCISSRFCVLHLLSWEFERSEVLWRYTVILACHLKHIEAGWSTRNYPRNGHLSCFLTVTRPCEQGHWDTWMVLDPWNQV